MRRAIRRIGLIVGAVIALFGLVGFAGVPLLLRHIMTGQVAAAMNRPVRVGVISFNPYTLKLDLDQLQIGERGTSQSFIDISHLRIRVSWASLFRLALVVKELHVERPVIHLVRTAEQRFNVSDLLDRPVRADRSHTPFRFAVSNLQLNDGTVQFDDKVLGGRHTIEQVQIDVPFISNLPADVEIAVQPLLRMVIDGSPLHISGKATPFSMLPASVVDLKLQQLDLSPYRTYLPQETPITFAKGMLSCSVKVHVVNEDSQPSIRLSGTMALDELDLRDSADAPLLELKHAVTTLTDVAPLEHVVHLGRTSIDGLTVHAVRNRNGTTNITSLMGRLAPYSGAQAQTTTAAKPATPTDLSLQAFELSDGTLHITDHSGARPVALALQGIHVELNNLRTTGQTPASFVIGAHLSGGGSVALKGRLDLAQSQITSDVSLDQLDLAAMEPYVSDMLNATISSAALTMNGALALATARDTLRLSYRGDATLGNVRMLDRVTSESVLRWNSFSASRIDAEIGSGPPKVQIGMLALTDFYTRLILNSTGRLNVLDMMASPQSAPASLTRAQPASDDQTPATSSAPAAIIARPIDAEIEIGGMTLQGGHVNFTDNFIKPNYTADLTDIAGTVGPFGTRATAPAAVALQGQVNGSAPIAINGSVNPLAPMAFVDLKAKADGVELTGLTPYSAKYTGYPIVKGTLTIDVHYLLDQGQLTADNHLFIDQLTFGDRVESDDATTLPVRLAVALLKNARGEIAVDVPVTGSLSDPQFSLSGVILDAFVNLIVKAVTSPFSLIASAFGTQEDLDYVEFAPGLATLTPDSQQKLATIAQALQDRPALRLDISGRVDPQFDREGLREARLASLIRMQKIKDIGGHEDADRVQFTPEEYDTYLTRVYKTATFPKPRNFLGLDKSLPPDEMKKLLLTNMEITDQDLQHLADRRANAVRQWLSGQVDPGRLFVVAPTLKTDGIKDKGKTTRVDLSLK